MIRNPWAVLLAVGVISPAYAAYVPAPPFTGPITTIAITVGTSSSQAMAQTSSRAYLDIVNNSYYATICINLGSAASISGTQCSAGEYTLLPLQSKKFDGSFVPSSSIYLISSLDSTPVTITVF